jgi:SAM-dependent methyltransferase
MTEPDDPTTYGTSWAPVYDEYYAGRLPTSATVQFLAGLANGAPVLELGVGTGRVAIPLALRGIEVHGIDVADAMLERLRAKPGGTAVHLQIGDCASVDIGSRFSVIYIIFNTLFSLLTQEAQLRCFASAAARLTDGGVLVVEAFVPDPSRFDGGQRVEVKSVTGSEVALEVSMCDAGAQRVRAQYLMLNDGRLGVHPVEYRYAWPAELDLMARLAGLRLADRYGGWDGEPFTDASTSHVSLYRAA